MLTNSNITVYHKIFDDEQRLEKWQRYYYENVWFFGGKGSSINKGYDNANDVDVRIAYNNHEDLDINNFAVGDIIIEGEHEDINTQQDLEENSFYNIKSINNNNFGNNPHIHLGGK